VVIEKPTSGRLTLIAGKIDALFSHERRRVIGKIFSAAAECCYNGKAHQANSGRKHNKIYGDRAIFVAQKV
jgi:hypothetical protein